MSNCKMSLKILKSQNYRTTWTKSDEKIIHKKVFKQKISLQLWLQIKLSSN